MSEGVWKEGNWPRGSTGVERYGFIPRSAANNLGKIPQKMGARNPFILKSLCWGGNTLGLVPANHPHSVGYACTLYAPTSPLPRGSSKEIFRQSHGFRGSWSSWALWASSMKLDPPPLCVQTPLFLPPNKDEKINFEDDASVLPVSLKI